MSGRPSKDGDLTMHGIPYPKKDEFLVVFAAKDEVTGNPEPGSGIHYLKVYPTKEECVRSAEKKLTHGFGFAPN